MRKTIIYETTICILFSLTMLFAEHSVAQEEITYQGPTVTISGRIDFPGYKEGLLRIRISAKSFPGEGRADIAYVDIPRPGEYSLKVPQNIGNVYISALILELVETVPRKGVSLGTQYNGNPLKIGYSDIKDVDIIIKEPILFMSTYEGPTVTISGRIDFPDYKEGQRIKVAARSFPVPGTIDIAYVDIPRPGEYSLKVPQNIGNVYISALILELGGTVPHNKGLSLGTQYNGNPIKVGYSDIKDVDIIIKEPTPFMSTYQGPTVTISGRIDFPGYKEGLLRIRISAKSFPGEGRADIAYVDISQPRKYSLKVPQNIGNVYISALILELGGTVPRKGVSLGTQYNGNPIKVNTEDISGVNITLPY